MSSSPAPFVYTDNSFRLTANWITAARAPLLIPMVYFYEHQQWVAGGTCFAISMLLDLLDGWLARRQQAKLSFILSREQQAQLTWWQVMNYPGNTPFGDWFDPLLDKIGDILGIYYVGPLWLSKWLTYPVVIIELFLQFVVRPMQRQFGVKAAANKFGKWKTNFYAWPLGIMPFVYVYGPGFVFNLAILIGLGLAMASSYHHLMPVVAAMRRQRAG